MRSRLPSELFASACVGALTLATAVANAQEGGAAPESPRPYFGFELGYGQTDNLGRDAARIRSAITTLGLDFGSSADRRHLDGTVVGDIEWQRYGAREVVDDEDVVGSLDGALTLHAVPDVLVWDFGYNYGQVRPDPLAPIGPENREATRVATTGPRLVLPLGPRNLLNLGVQQAEREYEYSTNLDSQVDSTTAGFTHALDDVTSLSLWASARETEYDNSAQAYDYESLSVSYTREFSSGGVDFSLGRAEIEYGTLGEPRTVGNLAWNRGVGARSRLRLWVSQDYTDSGRLFSNGGIPDAQSSPMNDGTDVVLEDGTPGSEDLGTNETRLTGIAATDQPFLLSAVGAQVRLDGRRTDVGVSVVLSESDYVADSTLDRDLEVFSVSIARNLGASWRLDLGMTFGNEQFVTTGVENEDETSRLGLFRAVGRKSSIGADYRRTRRQHGLNPYEEDLYRLSFTHDLTR